ncbi:nitrous oxide-stimulated promoter family protein [Sansalvadorimonas verongulae]|uniref:nitrous oxide-stimulated promoter family protein n=1 Tax=Sansalvadorimonas verongulae TaxID=2172824 RepID=UPI0012BD3B32|nr:nitrous oxide-stimulated promoter family protein [Sansalvadorimonas verongulae]MTI13381.1 nitrous oxide-stimulated promoter family protein [Sansalvadorimonas verongulae]
MTNNAERLQRENKTVGLMIALYCKHHHQYENSQLCPSCEELKAFCERRVERCVYGTDKPVCNKCPIHCYKPTKREQIRAVMRWAGPRMLLHHPVLAIRHLLAERRPLPPRPGKKHRKKSETHS